MKKSLGLPSRYQVKIQVRILWKCALEHKIPLKISHIYELISKRYGFENWDTFSASLMKNDKKVSR